MDESIAYEGQQIQKQMKAKLRILKSLRQISTCFLLVAAVLLLMVQAIAAQISAGTKPIYAIEFKPGARTTFVEGTVGPPETRGPDMTNDGSDTPCACVPDSIS